MTKIHCLRFSLIGLVIIFIYAIDKFTRYVFKSKLGSCKNIQNIRINFLNITTVIKIKKNYNFEFCNVKQKNPRKILITNS